jgi:hypothetical protein
MNRERINLFDIANSLFTSQPGPAMPRGVCVCLQSLIEETEIGKYLQS